MKSDSRQFPFLLLVKSQQIQFPTSFLFILSSHYFNSVHFFYKFSFHFWLQKENQEMLSAIKLWIRTLSNEFYQHETFELNIWLSKSRGFTKAGYIAMILFWVKS